MEKFQNIFMLKFVTSANFLQSTIILIGMAESLYAKFHSNKYFTPK